MGGQAEQSEQRAVRSESPWRDSTGPFKGCGGWSPGHQSQSEERPVGGRKRLILQSLIKDFLHPQSKRRMLS